MSVHDADPLAVDQILEKDGQGTDIKASTHGNASTKCLQEKILDGASFQIIPVTRSVVTQGTTT